MSFKTDYSALVFGFPRTRPPTPARDGADVSWLDRCRVGDNQGATGACTLFAFASWSEIVHGQSITDEACLEAYRDACARYNIADGKGMTFRRAFRVAQDYGWLPGATGLHRQHNLQALQDQPLIAGYAVTKAWRERYMRNGVLNHSHVFNYMEGYHAVVIVGHGALAAAPGQRFVYIENSWGPLWGHQGLGLMSEEMHTRLCKEVWRIVS